MLDIDHFKRLNDKHGHLVGDDFLRLISAVIAAEVKRPMDTACRYGGEEFAIILPDTSQEGATSIAECIRSGVESLRHQVGDESVPVTISIGIATLSPGQNDKPADIIVLADKALYRAKSEGRNRVVSC
jgi:diguanylate cyclase (GGDEF)-like protein